MCAVFNCLLQVISMVCHSVEEQRCASSFLIVCPASVLSNWANELQHWAPDLAVVQYRGSADAREEIYKKQVGGTEC
jgi:SWI/SNF-related matrix-associated actin-dependent regulator of chromatin subfamily A protein 2/4